MGAHSLELHHAAPRCLLRLYDEANEAPLDGAGIEAWLTWEEEAMRWSGRSTGVCMSRTGSAGEGAEASGPSSSTALLVCGAGAEEVGQDLTGGRTTAQVA
jgi:hypothetical protein